MTAVLAFLVLGQRISAYQTLLQDPVLAGQREIVLGLQPKDQETFGFYHSFVVGGKIAQGSGDVRFGADNYAAGTINMLPSAPQKEDVRVGATTWSVRRGVLGDQLCFVLATDGFRNQHAEVRMNKYQDLILNTKTNLQKTYWVAEDGTQLALSSEAVNEKGRWTMEVQFNKEDFDVEIDGPSGKTKRTIIPGCGMDKIQAQFKPMIKGDKVLMTEKEFYTLNPYNGAPEKNVAKIMGRFSGKFGPKPFKGRYIDIVREKGGERIFLSNEGLLMKVETPMDYFLYIEEVPR